MPINGKVMSHDISVVFQGPIISGAGSVSTLECVQSARTHLPDSEIVVSTWTPAQSVCGSWNIWVQSNEPLALEPTAIFNPNNLNRQIISTRAGLAQCSRRFAIKIRTDCSLVSDAILDALTYASTRRCTSGGGGGDLPRIVVCNIYTRNPRRFPFLYHVSDILMASSLEKIIEYWNAPLCIEETYDIPERYLTLSHLQRMGELVQRSRYSFWEALHFEHILVKRFEVYERHDLGIKCPPRYPFNNVGQESSCYTREEFVRLARIYDGGGYSLASVSQYATLLYAMPIQRLKFRGGWTRRLINMVKGVIFS